MNMKKNVIPQVAAIHDLSGFGRCSLSVVIPILSVMGVQVCPVPTAILSTHTGGFEDFTFVDLTDSMRDYIGHWEKLGIEFDAIYSGFLGSERQIDIVIDMIKKFKNDNTMVVIDPVFGDDGKLYSTFRPEIVHKMRDFIRYGDVITPNITEAAYLLGEEIHESMSNDRIKDWLRRLSDMGPKITVITSVPKEGEQDRATVVAYDKEGDAYWQVTCEYLPTEYPGTGDIFTSVMLGSLIGGDSIPMAIERGVRFVSDAIRATYGYRTPAREGVVIEKVLNMLSVPPPAYSYSMI